MVSLVKGVIQMPQVMPFSSVRTHSQTYHECGTHSLAQVCRTQSSVENEDEMVKWQRSLNDEVNVEGMDNDKVA